MGVPEVRIKHLITVAVTFVAIVMTAALSVTWHPILILGLLIDLCLIAALPFIARWEARHPKW